MSVKSKKMIPIMASTTYKEHTRAIKLEQKTDASISKQTYVASGLNVDE
jgi:hypothetical protein